MKETTYFHDKKNNKIFIYPRMKKCKNGIRVYLLRDVDEKTMVDYPVIIADCPNANSIEYKSVLGFEIIDIFIKKSCFFGLFNYWHKAENIKKVTSAFNK